MTLRGMTWDHPRGYGPLAAFDMAVPEVGEVTWDRQSLADFEAHPISVLASQYDLLVIDHPGLGAATAENALLPLTEVFAQEELDRWRSASVGNTWDSYHYLDQQWAIPIDAATQVSILRPDLVSAAPTRWQDITDFAQTHRTALCLGGPHALLMLLAICASDARGAARPSLLHVGGAVAALELLQRLWTHADHDTSLLDPIGVHEAMAADTDLRYCPLAYGYARYAQPQPGRLALSWAAAPSWQDGPPGSVLGGTGLAVSAKSGADLEEVRRYVRGFLADDVQRDLVTSHGGQPAHRAAWQSADVDARWGGYYSATLSSVESAWIRPRRPGWIAFQDQGSELVRESILGQRDAHSVIHELNRGYVSIEADLPQMKVLKP